MPSTTSDTRMSSLRPFQAWWAVAVLMILQSLAFLDRHILSLLIIEIQDDLSLTDFQMGLLQGLAFAAFYSFAGLFLGTLVDRYPARYVLFFSVTVWSLAATAVGVAKNYWSMMIARMMTGAGEGGVNPAAQALIASMFPRNRVSFPMSIFTMAGAIGIGLSYFGGGILLDWISAHSIPGLEGLAPWRQVLIVTAAPGLLIAFLSFTILETRSLTSARSSETHTWHAFRKFLAAERRLVTGLGLGYTLNVLVTYAAVAWAPTYGRRVLGMTPTEIGIQMGLISSLGSVLAGALYGYVIDRQFSRGRIAVVMQSYLYCAFLVIPLCVLGFIWDSRSMFLCSLVVLQCLWATAMGPGIAAIQMITPPEMRGKMAASIVTVANLSGYGIGGLIIGALTDYVFSDPQKLGLSIAVTVAFFGPISAWSIWSIRGHFAVRVNTTPST